MGVQDKRVFGGPRIIINESHNQKASSIMANAQLIAAAPDLYYALKGIIEDEKKGREVGVPKIYNHFYEAAVKALEKANPKL